jgi:hypothetical protein
MKFMTLVKSAENAGPPPLALMKAIGQLGQEAGGDGVMVQMGGLLPSAMGARVAVRKGRLTVIDGPYTEAKEVVGGFAVYDVPTKEAAIEWTRRFMELHRVHWPGWEGETELRQIFEPGDMPGGPH